VCSSDLKVKKDKTKEDIKAKKETRK